MAGWLSAASLATSARKSVFERGRRGAGLHAQFVERALGDQPAIGDDADAVSHAFGDFENMRGHDDGATGSNAFAQHVLDLARRAGIESGQRLVEHDQFRIVHQGAGERDLLAHTFGKPFATVMRLRLKPSHAINSRACRLGHFGVDAPQPGNEFEIFVRRQLVVDHRLVGQPCGDALGVFGMAKRVDAIDGDGTRVRRAADRRPCATSWSCRRHSAPAGGRIRRA